MSALDGKIAIGVDYRPCIVHIPAVTKTCYPDRKNTAKKTKYRTKKLLFRRKRLKPYFIVGITIQNFMKFLL